MDATSDESPQVLATLKGAPAFDFSWPEARRDAAVAAIADFLRRKAPAQSPDRR